MLDWSFGFLQGALMQNHPISRIFLVILTICVLLGAGGCIDDQKSDGAPPAGDAPGVTIVGNPDLGSPAQPTVTGPAPDVLPEPQPGDAPPPADDVNGDGTELPAGDIDGDSFSAEIDCDDTKSAVHPGAAEDPTGPLATLDADCDGLPGATATAGFAVAGSGSDDNPGTVQQPFKTIQKGFQVITAAGGGKRALFLFADTTYQLSGVGIPPGVHLLGGYAKTTKGITRDLDKKTKLVAKGPVTIAGTSVDTAPTTLSGLLVQLPDATSLLGIVNQSAMLHATAVLKNNLGAALSFEAKNGQSVELRLVQSEITHAGSAIGKTVALSLRSGTAGTARVRVEHSMITAVASKVGDSVGIWALGATQDSLVYLRVADSLVHAGNVPAGRHTAAVMLGYEVNGAAAWMGDVDIERSRLQSGSGTEPAVLKIHRAKECTVRSSIFTNTSGKGVALHITAAPLYAVNNSIRQVGQGIVIANITEIVQAITNNIFDIPKGNFHAALVLTETTLVQSLSHNLFHKELGAIALSGETLIPTTDDVVTLQQKLGVIAMQVEGNMVALPALQADGKLTENSPAIGKAKSLVSDKEPLNSMGDSWDVVRDIDGEMRSGTWDIGADEWPASPLLP